METQNQIKRTLSEPDTITVIRGMLSAEPGLNRTQVADLLCARLKLVDARGRKQRSGCLKALRKLEQQGRLTLPPVRRQGTVPRPRRLDGPVPEPADLPEEVNAILGLTLVHVESVDQMRIWNELMIREHPLGAGPLVGRQVRYLVGSGHGWLGAIGFGASALHLRDRDRWIGWDTQTRAAHLDKVVGLGRFLIRPSVRCANLASHVLGLCVRVLPTDFEDRYGYRPWLLETFVDPASFPGTCFRAANWLQVGRTQGRGRQDRRQKADRSVKDIYVYVLAEDFRQTLGLPAGGGRGPLGAADGLDGDGWAEQEFGAAELGDCRLTRRLVSVARAKAQNPGKAWTRVAKGDWPATKAYYRLIDQPEDSPITMPSIMQTHRQQTIRRMAAQQTVLCIQDGSDLNYSSLDQCEGLGQIGSNQTGARSRGLHLHSTLAVSARGLPLGVLRAHCTAPAAKRSGTKTAKNKSGRKAKVRAYRLPIEQKETFSWIEGLRDCNEAGRQMPHTRLVSVMDREADFFELFDEWRKDPRTDLLVRALYNRETTEGVKLFHAVRNTEVRHSLRLPVPRQSARPKRSGQPARPARAARMADVVLRYTPVEIKAPYYPGQQRKAAVPVWIIHVLEEHPPHGVKPLEWFLITTVHIHDAETALQCVRWYCLRWRIEDWHRVLKSGCRIEDLAHKTADRLRRAIAINLVVAWRIMLMTLLGREAPELPAEVLFSDIEIEVLRHYAKKTA